MPTNTPEDASEGIKVPSQPGLPLMVLGMLGLVVALHVFVGAKLLVATELPPGAQVAGWLVLAALFVAIPVSFALKRSGSPAGRWVQPVAYGWLGTFGVLISALAAAELVRTLATFLTPEAASLHTRRTEALAVVTVVALLVAWAFRTARGKAQIVRTTVPLPRGEAGLRGLTVVQVSDLHIGEDGLDRRFLARMVDQVNALDPDVIAITGDLVEGALAKVRTDLEPLSDLKAKLGVFYVTGNHEYYWGGPIWETEVARHGITVLHNEHRVVERNGARVVIGGVTDYDGAHFSEQDASRPDRAFAGAPEGVPRILLAHQPRSAAAAAKAGVDLQLSGHTHGGQIFPFNFFVRMQQPAVKGLKKLFGIWVYTHRGTGYWGPPMRLGPTPEIAQLTLDVP